MDSTLIKGESLDEIAHKAGVGEEVSKITRQTMNGELDFNQSIIRRVSLLKGVKQSVLDEIIEETVLTSGANLIAPTMKKNGAYCFILSGGFDFLTSQVARKIGFDGSFSNSLEIKNSQLTGNINFPIFGMHSKLQTLTNLCNEKNISVKEAAAIGDGANDLEMLKKAGLGVAFNGKPILKKVIKTQLNHTDLVGLLFLQGYDISEIY
jgi:phosphoserine phosphatase